MVNWLNRTEMSANRTFLLATVSATQNYVGDNVGGKVASVNSELSAIADHILRKIA